MSTLFSQLSNFIYQIWKLRLVQQEGGQALIIAARICAQSVRSLGAPSPTSVAVLGFFYSSQTPHRHNSSPLLTDIGAHSSHTFTDMAQRQSVRILRAFLTDLHRPSPPFTELHRHCAQPVCAHSARIPHRRLWKFYPLSVKLLADCAQMRAACPPSSNAIIIMVS